MILYLDTEIRDSVRNSSKKLRIYLSPPISIKSRGHFFSKSTLITLLLLPLILGICITILPLVDKINGILNALIKILRFSVDIPILKHDANTLCMFKFKSVFIG